MHHAKRTAAARPLTPASSPRTSARSGRTGGERPAASGVQTPPLCLVDSVSFVRPCLRFLSLLGHPVRAFGELGLGWTVLGTASHWKFILSPCSHPLSLHPLWHEAASWHTRSNFLFFFLHLAAGALLEFYHGFTVLGSVSRTMVAFDWGRNKAA